MWSHARIFFLLVALLVALPSPFASAQESFGFDPLPMLPKFIRENDPHFEDRYYQTSVVTYLKPGLERERYRASIRRGKFYDADNKPMNAHAAIFVLSKEGALYISTKPKKGSFHHSSLVAGDTVAAAGEIHFQNGFLVGINGNTGHYIPEPPVISKMISWLEENGADLSQLHDGERRAQAGRALRENTMNHAQNRTHSIDLSDEQEEVLLRALGNPCSDFLR